MPPNVTVVHGGRAFPDHWSAAVFLAGPTPRTPDVPSWRPDAIRLLRERWNGDGRLAVLSPEPPAGFHPESTDQAAWERRALDVADVIAFWVPRDPETMPALTTNIEWGAWLGSGKVVLGAPPHAPSNDYLFDAARAHHLPTAETLPATIDHALDRVGPGRHRCRGERDIPLHVWNTDAFQRWHSAQREAGNTLLGGRTEWTFRIGPDRRTVFYWAVHVRMHVAADDRIKDNEVVIGRPDTAQVVLYRRAPELDDTAIVLVREFRSPGEGPDGFVHELPGGSSPGALDLPGDAVEEVAEETGLHLRAERLLAHGRRQFAATAIAHGAHLYSAAVTDDELAWLRTQHDTPHGVEADSERTWVEVTTYGRIRRSGAVDWSTLGMIAQVLGDRTAPTREGP